jgi:hypothetical protein
VAASAHISYQNKFPILARQVLVGGLDDGIVEDVGLGTEHGVCVSPVGGGMERQGARGVRGQGRRRFERTKGAGRYSRESRLWEM